MMTLILIGLLYFCFMVWDSRTVEAYSNYDDSELSHLYPLFHELLSDVSGKQIVDYGCGDGKLLEELLLSGASCYGYDISAAMVEEARKRIGNKAELRVIESGKIPLSSDSVDAVVSNLVLMMCKDVQVIKDIFTDVFRILKKNALWIFSLTHPAFAAYEFTTHRNVFVGNMNYFFEGQSYQFVLRTKSGVNIVDSQFVDYHYPLSTYFNLLSKAGFCFEEMREVKIKENDYPPYLVIKARK